MMDTISVHATQREDGVFMVAWKWRCGKALHPVMGKIAVTVDPVHTEDRAALAELRALYYLLEDRQIHGPRRLGKNLHVEISSGAVRKALLKGSLKVYGVGKTAKNHIAMAAGFLATKYFEAKVDAAQWRDETPAREEDLVQVEQGYEWLYPTIACPLLQCHVGVTRHAMHRLVGRIDQKRDQYSEDDLSDVPDARWGAAWRWLETILANPNLCVPKLTAEAKKRTINKYGEKSFYLHFPDAQTIFIGSKDKMGNDTIVSVLRENVYRPMIQPRHYILGQRVISAKEMAAVQSRSRQRSA